MSEEIKVKNGQVISMEYTLTVDGSVADSSEGREPLQYVQGAGNIIPGLERELLDMEVGQSKEVTVAAVDAYGEQDDEAFMEVPSDQFPKEVPMEIGTELQVQNEAGQPMYARIVKIEDKNVRLDFNHPLAGKDLHFAVKVVNIRDATSEETEHGHVHGPGGHHQ